MLTVLEARSKDPELDASASNSQSLRRFVLSQGKNLELINVACRKRGRSSRSYSTSRQGGKVMLSVSGSLF